MRSTELAKFREFRDERSTTGWSDAGDRFEQFAPRRPVIVRLDQFRDRFIQGCDLFVEHLDQLEDAATSDLGCGLWLTITFDRSDAHQLATTCDQRIEFNLFFRTFIGGTRLDLLRKDRQCFGIDAIGLGKSSHRSGEVAHLSGIHHRDGQSGINQLRRQTLFQASRGFHHDQTRSQRQEPFFQRG